ncbi:MAG: cell division protein ZapA [Roseitalea sp.]|jgi:cell division protein ZapA|uniref:Cell division protein ZapA n=1 Tax=Oceaniradius stylonematis TaxID=2184161 RepID=A0A3A8AEF8_9HYPH|nr:cell division protein ZapA [Oceaniradius stylonematis]MBO6551800.1 cell division protein ZapA [Roseitalea sp.]MBO6951820.1 cell division protein ZapA [Rhizobiaceae bacterium]RNC95749.1 MAG: cell division protein ZapA [Oricola sp.]MBO6592334.1 cell division protein ZapA [Roseitalea sp.]MBO6598589.1 cell division protein ZapA [Roseitalea sp.]
MSQVTVTIDQKSYRMACDPGQEDHLVDLAGRLDKYVTHLKGSFGEIGDLRLTVMAGIMIMDELSELQKRVKGLESELDSVRKTRDEALSKADRVDETLTERLTALADKIESVTAKIA